MQSSTHPRASSRLYQTTIHIAEITAKGIYLFGILPLLKVLVTKARPAVTSSYGKKILVNFGDHGSMALGDMIFTNTFIAALKFQFPDSRLSLVVSRDNPWLESFWRAHSAIDEFLVHPDMSITKSAEWLNYYKHIQTLRFDLCIIMITTFSRGFRTKWFPLDPAILTAYCRISTIMGEYAPFDQSKFLSKKFNMALNGPHWLDEIGVWAKNIGMTDIQIQQHLKPYFRFKPVSPIQRLTDKICISINHGGGRYWNRRWPLEKFKNLCDILAKQFDVVFFLLGGPDEYEERAEIRDAIISRHPNCLVINERHLSLNETANYIARSKLFIGNDSGPTHLAAAISVPTVTIFGPTDPKYFGADRIDNSLHTIIKLGLPCQPCQSQVYSSGIFDCHLKEKKYGCLNDVPVSMVLEEVIKKIRSTNVN